MFMPVGIIGGSWSRSGCDACEDGEPGRVEGRIGTRFDAEYGVMQKTAEGNSSAAELIMWDVGLCGLTDMR